MHRPQIPADSHLLGGQSWLINGSNRTRNRLLGADRKFCFLLQGTAIQVTADLLPRTNDPSIKPRGIELFLSPDWD